MSVEGLLFYGITIAGHDSGWKRLNAKYDSEIGRMLVKHFHADLLESKEWIKRFGSWGSDYENCLATEFERDDIFGGCRIRSYRDLRRHSSGYYIAIQNADFVGRTQGAAIDPKLVNRPPRRRWDARIRQFCQQLGIGFRDPGWNLAFFWC